MRFQTLQVALQQKRICGILRIHVDNHRAALELFHPFLSCSFQWKLALIISHLEIGTPVKVSERGKIEFPAIGIQVLGDADHIDHSRNSEPATHGTRSSSLFRQTSSLANPTSVESKNRRNDWPNKFRTKEQSGSGVQQVVRELGGCLHDSIQPVIRSMQLSHPLLVLDSEAPIHSPKNL